MSKDNKTRGIILSKTKFAENDIIFDILSEDGSLKSFFAKGAQKIKSHLSGILQIGQFVNIVYSKGSNFYYPKEITLDLKNCFTFYKENLELLNYYGDIINVTRIISRDINSTELFTTLIENFQGIQSRKKNALISYNSYLEFCLKEAGVCMDDLNKIERDLVSDKILYYHIASNRIFLPEEKPKYLDLPSIKYDEVFKKQYLQKLFYQHISSKIRLKF